MPTKLVVYQNGDDALLVWNVDQEIDECRGFAIRRKLTRDGHTNESWLENQIGFAGEAPTPGQKRPSTEWPFQGFGWTDHAIGEGDSAQYRVTPVIRAPNGELELLDQQASEWSDAPPDPNDAPTPYFAYFNRGYVMSQFMAHYLAETGKTLAEFKETIGDQEDRTIRAFLSGELRLRLLEVLDQAKADGGEVYASLFELSDDELVGRLEALGERAHVVLGNGSISKRTDETLDAARLRDQNEAERERLRAAGVDVGEHDRFVSPGALSHNKFLAVTDADGNPQVAWTGSTNWSPTGLCTQLNNGLLVRDPEIAAAYLEQWKRLRAAASAFPSELVTANSEAKPVGETNVWFTRSRNEVDLAALREVVDSANKAILFLMFMPGGSGLLADVKRRQAEPGLFVRGVVSTLPNGYGDESAVDVSMVGDGQDETPHRLDVVQPQGIENSVAFWAAEATRSQFLSNIGFAIIHSKVVVIDPFSDNATVVTGSHNFSKGASGENDENFVIVRNNRPLAAAYVVNILGAWRHYSFRVKRLAPYEGLKDSGAWMRGSMWARKQAAGLWGF